MEGGVKKRKKQKFGHLKGVETVKKIVKSSIKLKIPTYFLCFFVENWKRPKKEIYLFKQLKITFQKKLIKLLHKA